MTGAALQVGVGLSGSITRFLAGLGLPDTVAGLLGQILAFVAVFAVIYLVGRNVLIPIINRMMISRELEAHARRPIRRLLVVIVAFVGITVAFGAAGFPDFLRSLATIAAAATLAIGFAMQDVLKNFVSGIFIYTDKPFRIGDWIQWDGNSGIVEDISFRVTRIKTFDNELLTVPNSQLTDGVIKNPVAKGQLRVQVPFGIGYDDDIETATDIILEEARNHEGILEDPEPTVRLTELGDSSVTLTSRVWIGDPSRSDFVRTRAEYVQTVKRRFDEEDINIPYPNRTLGGELTLSGLGEVESVGE